MPPLIFLFSSNIATKFYTAKVISTGVKYSSNFEVILNSFMGNYDYILLIIYSDIKNIISIKLFRNVIH